MTQTNKNNRLFYASNLLKIFIYKPTRMLVAGHHLTVTADHRALETAPLEPKTITLLT